MSVKKSKCVFSVLIAVTMLYSLCGCESLKDVNQSVGEQETADVQSIVQSTEAQSVVQDNSQNAQSGEDLDVIEPDAADDDWYRSGDVYTDEN